MGHPPFGHAGEEALNECMDDFGGFDHNIQTLRILTLLENKYYNFPGLNLSIETLDGLVKHNGPVLNTSKYHLILGKNIFKKKINFNSSPSVESQISSISDDIAYNSHDLEDGLKALLFQIDDLDKIPVISDIIYKHKKKLRMKDKELVLRQIVRDIINEMVKDVIINTRKNLKYAKLKNINDVYKTKIHLVNFSDKMINFDLSIKSFLKARMYNHKSVLKKTKQGQNIVKALFLKIKKNPTKFIKRSALQNFSKERSVCDFIAGMTDRYATNLHNSIK